MYNFFAFMNRMKYIERWSLMRSTRKENIMEHSEQVAMFAHALAVIGNKFYGKNYDANRIGMIAAYHETSEVITGDLPTPIKYFNPEIKSAYKALEKTSAEKLVAMLPEELKEEYSSLIISPSYEEHKIMKCADKLSAYVKCVEELNAGNKEFLKAEKSIKKELEKFDLPECEYFIKNFLPSFSLTLDELE